MKLLRLISRVLRGRAGGKRGGSRRDRHGFRLGVPHVRLLVVMGLGASSVCPEAGTVPVILKHPVDVTAAYGDAVTLRVEAIGPSLSYRWEKLPAKASWLPVTVGTRETLAFDRLEPGHAGRYRVVVTSAGYGSATSREFTIAFPADRGTDRIRVVKQPTPVRAGRPVGRGVVMDGRFYYPGYDPEGGVELWVTDGTAAESRRVKDIQPGSANGLVVSKGANDSLGVLQGKLYFVADDGENGRALWVSDGTSSGTQLLQTEFLFVRPGSGPPPDHEGISLNLGSVETAPRRYDSAQDLQADGFAVAGGVLYFKTASSGVQALGRTDGTAAGTGNLLPDRGPSQEHYAFLRIEAITRRTGGGAFFVATTSEEGRELWVTDGTRQGTRLVRDIRAGWGDGIVAARLIPSPGRVFLMAGNLASGQEPWVSDGTSGPFGGTFQLADIQPGTGSSLAFEFTVVSDEVFFSAQSPTGFGLWRTDGTVAGTRLVREFEGGISRLLAAGPAVRPDRLYLMARDAATGFELWRSDGTAEGTVRVSDQAPGTGSSFPLPLANSGASLFFLNESPETARALWFTDGSEAGTVRLTEARPSLKHALLRSGSDTYFASYKTEGGRDLLIHRTGGSVATTVELARLPFVGDTELQWADLGARKVLNTAARGTANLLTGELVVTDGTSGGTGFLNLPAVPATFGSLTPFRGGLLFTAPVDEYTAGLYRTEGLTTILLRTYPANSARGFGVAGNSRAIIVPESADWQQAGVLTTDGTPEGTQALSLATDASRPSTIAALGDTFILSAGQNGFDEVDLNSFDGVDPSYLARNAELFRISPAGAVTLLKEIRSGSSLGSYPWFLTRVGEGVCFFAHSAPDGLAMWENYSTGLWKTDGTPAGTTFIEPVEPPATGFGPPAEALRPGVLGSRFFFGGTSKLLKTGIELWKSDGSAMGTVHLKNIYPGTYWDEQSYFFGTAPVAVPSSSDPAEFTAVGNTLFFAATSPLGRELWKTDGTAAGTVLVKDLSTGDEESPALPGDVLSWMYAMFGGGDGTYPATAPARNVTNPTNLVAVAGKLYFVARDNEGTKLFRSDGTAAGTVPIEGLRSGFSRPRELIAANDRLYYVRGPLALKAQLWEYDPATETHRAVTSLAGGVVNPARLTVADGRIYFVGDDGEGQKLLAYERVPLIREHPATQTLLAGGSTTLEIVPGVPGLAHAWRRGLGFALPVGSDPTLVVPASSVTAQPYSVRVTSTDGRVQNSQLAFLNVLDPATSQNIQRFPDSWWTKEPAPPEPDAVAVPGTLDPAWGTSNMVNGSIVRIIALSDGKALAAGTFSEIAGQPAPGLARLHHDGTLDTTFNVGAGPAGGVADMAVLPDGKIAIVGGFLTVNGYQRERVARLHPDGSVDLAFNAGLGLPGIQSVLTVLPAAGGKLYLGGIFDGWGGHPTVSLVRLNGDGTVDTAITLNNQPNVGGPFRVAALAYYPSEADPQWLIVGGGTYYVEAGNGFTNQRRHLARLDATTGAWDPTFNLAPIPTPPTSVDGSVSRIAVLPDGKLLVGGIQGGGLPRSMACCA